MARERLGEILIRAGLLDEAGLQRALNEQQRWGGQLGRYLVELGLISEEILVRALSTQYKIPAVGIEPDRMDLRVGRLISREVCERYSLICFRADSQGRFLDVAMANPANLDAIDEVRVATQSNVRPFIAAPSAIDKAISYVFYGDIGYGEMDLGPESRFREDANDSELHKKARQIGTRGGDGAAKQGDTGIALAPGVTAMTGGGPGLDVKVSLSEQQATAAKGAAAPASARPPQPKPPQPKPPQPKPPQPKPPQPDDPGARVTRQAEAVNVDLPQVERDDGGFHITLDVPTVDNQRSTNARDIADKLSRIEVTLARNSAILKSLLEILAGKGLLTKHEIRKIISSGDRDR